MFFTSKKQKELENELKHLRKEYAFLQDTSKEVQNINQKLYEQLKDAINFSEAQVQTNRKLQSRQDQILQQIQNVTSELPADLQSTLRNIYAILSQD